MSTAAGSSTGMENVLVVLEKCPLCGSRDLTQIKEVEYPEGTLKISRCGNCSISFSSTRFSDDFLNEKYYSKNYEEEVVGSADYADVSKRFFRGIINHARRVKPGGRWLDVGCGRGYLLDAASKFDFDCHGIDLKSDFLRNPNITFHNQDFLQFDFGGIRFDIITMINILDHIGAPAVYLEKVYGLLKPGGVLLIHVPNEHYFNKTMLPSGYTPNVHIVNYSEKNIGAILKRFGFSKVEFLSPTYKLRKSKRTMVLISLLEAFNRCAIVFNKGVWFSMQVIARK